jgi:hypothetical protein
MAEVTEDLKERVINYLKTVPHAKNREVARALGEDKGLVDKAIADLSKEDRIEYIYLGASFVKVKDA